jgi:hypothetical protein
LREELKIGIGKVFMAMNFDINVKDNASVSMNNINKSLNLLGKNFINLDQSNS